MISQAESQRLFPCSLYSIIGIIAVVLMAAPGLCAQEFADLAGEIRIPVPAGWKLAVDTGDYPFILYQEGTNARLSIFKRIIDQADAVENEDQLREVVDEIIGSVILTLPDARLLTNTGFYETNVAGFSIGFTSLDTLTSITIRNRLHTALYRAPDDSQIMFTLWGKAPRDEYPDAAEALEFIQDEFAYTAPHADYVFGDRPVQTWPYMILLAMILAAILLLSRRFWKRAPESRFAD